MKTPCTQSLQPQVALLKGWMEVEFLKFLKLFTAPKLKESRLMWACMAPSYYDHDLKSSGGLQLQGHWEREPSPARWIFKHCGHLHRFRRINAGVRGWHISPYERTSLNRVNQAEWSHNNQFLISCRVPQINLCSKGKWVSFGSGGFCCQVAGYFIFFLWNAKERAEFKTDSSTYPIYAIQVKT